MATNSQFSTFMGTTTPICSLDTRSEEFYQTEGESQQLEESDGTEEEAEYVSDEQLRNDLACQIAKAEKKVQAGHATPNELMLSVLPLITKKCGKAAGKIGDEDLFADLKSQCIEEVLKAALAYDASKGANFCTYVYSTIDFAITHARQEAKNSDTLEKKVFDAVKALKQEALPNGLVDLCAWSPSISDLKEYLTEQGVSISEGKIAKILREEGSANAKLGDEDEEDASEVIETVSGGDEFRIYGEAPSLEELEDALFLLCKKNKEAADKVYLFCVEGLDYAEIGGIYHITDKAVGASIRAFKESLQKYRYTYPGQVVEDAIRCGLFKKCRWGESDRFDNQPSAA